SRNRKRHYSNGSKERDNKRSRTESQDKCMSWEDLPEEILSTVFRFLSNSEKINAALVNKSWKRVFSVPSHWVYFDINLTTITFEQGLDICKLISSEIKELTINSETYRLTSTCQCVSVRVLVNLFRALIDKEAFDIKQIRLLNMSHILSKVDNASHDLVALMTILIKKQKNLRYFKLDSVSMTTENSCDILDALTGKISVRSLNLIHIAKRPDEPIMQRLRSLLRSMNYLENLQVGNVALNDSVLGSLALSVSKLTVHILNASDPPSLVGWKFLMKINPELKLKLVLP
ncbi:F-box only protein 39, partial [Biomphalaria glabrata]